MNTVGKFFIIGFEGTDITPEIKSLISEYRVGTIILSGRNFLNAKQAKKLILSLQTLAWEQNYEYPINFIIDEEGGMLNSLFDEIYITQFPGAMALAATGDTQIIYDVYRAIAKELKSIGFSMCMGPVLDILKNTTNNLAQHMIGVRSFGYSLDVVVKCAEAAARAFKDENFLNCGKHFPGYGSATVNSNFELPMILESTEQLLEFNAIPYIKLMEKDLLDSVLVGGCAVSGVNNTDLHACLSPTIVSNILRDKLNFNGVVVSECLLLEALDRNFGVVQGCISAFSVGCDLIMVCSNFEIQKQAISALASVIDDQLIDSEILQKSSARIKNLQMKLPSWDYVKNNIFLDQDILYQHKLLSVRAYESAITVIRDAGLPITKYLTPNIETENAILILTPLISPLYETVDIHGNRSHINNKKYSESLDKLNYGEDVFIEFGKMLSDYKPGYKIYHTSYNSNGLTSFHEELILKSNVVLFFTAETTTNMYQVGVSKHVSMLCNTGKRNDTHPINRQMIIISVSSPTDFLYDINIGGLPTGYICTYDYTINALCHLPKILFGDFKSNGKIPGIPVQCSTEHKPLNKTNKNRTHSWLVEKFDYKRDWGNCIQLLKSNNYLDFLAKEASLNGLKRLFMDTENHTSFVVRNTSSKTILGISVTWVSGGTLGRGKTGNLIFLLVDKNKRGISIGSHLYTKTIKFLMEEQKCTKLFLGRDFPKFTIINDLFTTQSEANTETLRFFQSYGWDFSGTLNNMKSKNPLKRNTKLLPIPKTPSRISINNLLTNDTVSQSMEHQTMKYLMKLDDVRTWKVAEYLVRQLQVVGVMFDIRNDPTDVFLMLKTKSVDENNTTKHDYDNPFYQDDCDNNYEIYSQLYEDFNSSGERQFINDKGNLDIIVALEPTRRSVVGSLIVFTNESKFTKFYPFLETLDNSGEPFVCIAGHHIDPSYTTLFESFKLGLVCTALMYVKGKHSNCKKCYILDVGENQLRSLQSNGFKIVEKYYNFYSLLVNDNI
ncbi:hypothetical protein CANINC_000081 [Pichia inconspicua]|uniref:Glycoside hydrolase family 3 N-terminal domain-containing protein n=1 Tax=Pichia inconspicua TaxID=52247 RepID=A0A4V4NGB5_9ASCO|nr:hypothetical protein CANINC_000081 [[Candida] inconspicua]